MNEPDPRYPIGRFAPPERFDANSRREIFEAVASLPTELRAATSGLSDEQLDTPYRAGGWTLRQVVHHLADSHLNAYVRLKLALTETEPTIRTYDEGRWAELPDARTAPIAPSLALLEALHWRWVACLRTLPVEGFERPLRHPDRGAMTVDHLMALYAWHGRHHVAHVTGLATRLGWR